MRNMSRNIAMAIAAVSLMGVQSVFAAPWSSNANGVAPSGHFSWDNGQTTNGFFDNPTVTPDDKFVFSVGGFAANDTTDDGVPVLVDETVSWDLHVAPGFQLTGMEVRISGVYTVRGVGSYVNTGALFEVEEFADQGGGAPRVFTGPLTVTPEVMPAMGAAAPRTVNYSAVATVDVSFEVPMPDDDLHISFYNFLEAFRAGAGLGHQASINEQFQQFEIEIALIPEPTTLALVGMGAVVALRRRR